VTAVTSEGLFSLTTRVVMIGSGYVGLVSGACFAGFGHEVVCVDKDGAKIDALNAGVMPIYEPGLAELVADNVAAGRLSFTTDLAAAVAGADAVFIAVGTPARPGDGQADLQYVFAAAGEVADALTGPCVLVDKSTVPVGTGDRVEALVAERRPGLAVSVVSNPEFLREGVAIADFQVPDRVVVGVDDGPHADAARAVMAALYASLDPERSPVLFTGRRTAELTKYAANAFLATKVTFINEMADLCEGVGADVGDVALGIGLDHRIGRAFLQAGPGYGGSCFPKDTLALLGTAAGHGVALRVVDAVVGVNEARKEAMGRKVLAALGPDPAGKTVALLGLTFKPDTDDMRDAPSITIARVLAEAGVTVRGTDPEGLTTAARVMPDLRYHADPYGAARGAHAAVIVTEWPAYKNLDLRLLCETMAQPAPALVDLRNVFSKHEAEAAGLRYTSLGK